MGVLWRCGRCGRAVQTHVGPLGACGCAYGCAQAGHVGGDLELVLRNGGRTGWQRRQLHAGGGHMGVENVPYGTEKISLSVMIILALFNLERLRD
jgi:hypothetical protein